MGGRVRGGGGQGRSEQRIESFVKNKKKTEGGGGRVGRIRLGRVGGQGGSEQKIEVFVKIQKKIGGGGGLVGGQVVGGGGGGSGWM